jgi:hypothetical protein
VGVYLRRADRAVLENVGVFRHRGHASNADSESAARFMTVHCAGATHATAEPARTKSTAAKAITFLRIVGEVN